MQAIVKEVTISDYTYSPSCFSQGEVLLPVPILSADNAPAGMQSRSRILIVDDEQDICALLIHYLDGLGYECVAVGDSREALNKVQNNKMDLIITDLSMPGMDGIELLREIKRRDDNIPVLMITGDNDPLSIIDAMKTGADDYILKPFALQNISLGIRGSLQRSAIRRQIQAFQKNLERMLLERTLGYSPSLGPILLLNKVDPLDHK